MSETTDVLASPAAGEAPKRPRRGSGLSGMVLAELQSLAAELGVSGTGKMRKSDLIAAIQERRSGAGNGPSAPSAGANGASAAPSTDAPASQPVEPPAAAEPVAPQAVDNASPVRQRPARQRPERADVSQQPEPGADGANVAGPSERQPSDQAPGSPDEDTDEQDNRRRSNNQNNGQGAQNRNRQNGAGGNIQNSRTTNNRAEAGDRNPNDRGANDRNANAGDRNTNDEDDDRGSGGGRRRRRGRDRFRDRDGNRQNTNNSSAGNNPGGRSTNNNNRERYNDSEPQVSEDDVLIPIAGILDVLDNYAFVRTSGYLTGSNDVYVSLSQVRRYGLRRGDALTGAVKQPREGERREKFNALVRLDTINGLDPEAARHRPEFTKLTPLYPQQRLRLETTASQMTTRVIDLVMPIGKGQRALIVSPPKAGKTMVLQAIANAITTNNPECHLMVVLVDERPEEVTDMQRSVKGEVIASTFDRPPSDHTTVAELAIERAKRLVELGHDVVVLLDSITRLGRAYNLAAPTSGRILSGGVDSTALYPPKRFLGAARNIENGGSLTIIATALVETGSTMDTVIFEEFKGTGNAELKLDRRIADKRVFPAIDVDPSGTRKEEILLAPDELAVVIKLRRVLHALEPQAALDLLLDRLRKTQTNTEFLMQIAKSTPSNDD